MFLHKHNISFFDKQILLVGVWLYFYILDDVNNFKDSDINCLVQMIGNKFFY